MTVLPTAVRKPPARADQVEPLDRDHRNHVTFRPDFRRLLMGQRVLQQPVMMGLDRIGLSRAQRDHGHEFGIALVRGDHDHRPTLHDLRLDVAREIAVNDRARLGLEI